jgi:hypothetical protein
VYLDDGNGAELATSGDVGVVLIFVTDDDDVIGVVVTGLWGRSMTVVFVLGELKSNDNRDLWK